MNSSQYQTETAFQYPEQAVLWIMRVMGVATLLAAPCILLPYEWMNACHQFMGLGTLPHAPIVSYLARSLSLFYAIFGAITLFVSFDIRRYRPLVQLWGALVTISGILLLGIDIVAGMPLNWMIGEGPPTIAIGLIVFYCSQRIIEQTLASRSD